MAGNKIPDIQSRLWALAADAADGLMGHGVEIQVAQNTEDRVRANLAASKAAEKAWQDALTAENEALAAHRTANSNAKGFLALARCQLADAAGNLPPGLWPAGTTAIPNDEDKRTALLGKIATHLRYHVGAANPKKNFTAAAATAAAAALTATRKALNETVCKRVKAKGARDNADQTLHQRLSALRDELELLLEPDSEDWYWFGLTPPAGAERPAKPAGLHAAQVNRTTILAGWPHPPRAEKCRILLQVVSRDTDFVAQYWTRENEDLIQNLPAKSTVRLKLITANAAGDSAESDMVEVMLA